MRKVLLLGGIALASLQAVAALSAKSYITDGLIGHWDGIENVSYGGDRDASATTWKDLVDGSLNITVPTEASFATDATALTTVRANGVKTTAAVWTASKEYTAFKAANYTVEVAYRQDEAISTGGGYNYRITFLSFGADGYWLGTRANNTLGFNGSFGSGDSVLAVYQTVSANGTLGKHTLSCSHGEGTAKVVVDGDIAKSVTAEKTGAASPATSHGFAFNKPGYWDNNGLPGAYYSIRYYDRVLSDNERIVNNAVDKVRYFGVDSSTITLPSGWRWSGTGGAADVSLECQCTCSVDPVGAGLVSVDGGTASASSTYWMEKGSSVQKTFVATANDGYAFVGWVGEGLTAEQKLNPSLSSTVSGSVTAVFRKTDGSDPRTYTWQGTSVWDDRMAWRDEDGIPGVPLANDSVVIPSGKTALLTNATPKFAALTVGGTLSLTNWMTCVRATDFTIQNGGIVKPVCAFGDTEMSNRVWIACSNLTLATGGKINADLLGFKGKCGPGKGTGSYGAAAHGGAGGTGSSPTYGSLTKPEAPGSGGGNNDSRYGGGAVRIDATGGVVINGEITAMGETSAVWQGGGGSGGSVWITCLTIDGTGSVKAGGKDYSSYPYAAAWYHGGGGGGRVSVCYDATAQNAKDATCNVRFEARGGYSGYMNQSGLASNGYPDGFGGLGTLYFTDNRFLTNAVYRTSGWKFSGVWNSPVALPNGFTFDGDTTFDTCWLDLQKAGMSFTFAGKLTMKGAHARLDKLVLRDAQVTVAGDMQMQKGGGFYLEGGSLAIGGNLTMEGDSASSLETGAELQLIAGPTNGPNQVGAELKVAGTLNIKKYATLHLQCCATNGAIPTVSAGNFYVATNGVVMAQEKGWGLSLGYGNGSASGYTGAAYGGYGGTHVKGKNKRVYGNYLYPVWPGSSSANVRGGGAVYIATPGKFQHFGKINASSTGSHTTWRAGGSGGSVYISCRKLMPSTGRIEANGGIGGNLDSPGGGGRIAIYANLGSTNGMTITASAGVQDAASYYSGYDPPTDGTVFWKRRGGMQIILR